MNYPTLKNGERDWCATCEYDGIECKYEEECFYPRNSDGTYNHDLQPTCYKDKSVPTTNADRIRATKTEEELMKAIFHALKMSRQYTDSRSGMIEWLKETRWGYPTVAELPPEGNDASL